RNVKVTGEDVRVRATCESEGACETVDGRYTIASTTSIRLRGKVFSLWASTSDESRLAANYAPVTSSGKWYDEEYQQCDGSTVDIVQCVAGLRDAWDKRLNAAYRQVMEAESGPQKDALLRAQRQWIAYRDSNCAYYAGGQGSISRIEASVCEYA